MRDPVSKTDAFAQPIGNRPSDRRAVGQLVEGGTRMPRRCTPGGRGTGRKSPGRDPWSRALAILVLAMSRRAIIGSLMQDGSSQRRQTVGPSAPSPTNRPSRAPESRTTGRGNARAARRRRAQSRSATKGERCRAERDPPHARRSQREPPPVQRAAMQRPPSRQCRDRCDESARPEPRTRRPRPAVSRGQPRARTSGRQMPPRGDSTSPRPGRRMTRWMACDGSRAIRKRVPLLS